MALVAAWLMDEGSGTTAAEYGGNTTLDFILSNVSLGAGGIDFSGAANDSAQISSSNNGDIQVSAPFTLAFQITTDSADATNQQFFHATDEINTYSGFNALTNSTGVLEFMYGDDGGIASSDRRSTVANTLSTSTTYLVVIVVTDTSGAASGVTVYVGGVDETSGTSGSGGAMVYTASPTTIGEWISRVRDSDHTHRFAALYDHAFSGTEVSDITSDYESFIAGGGGVTPVPPKLHNIGNQFSVISAHRLNGVLE